MKRAALLALVLAGCASGKPFEDRAEAVPFCLVLGEVPVVVDGRVRCSHFEPTEESPWP